jgi:hypothetical protein
VEEREREVEIERERKKYARTRRGERKILTRKNFNTQRIGCEYFVFGSLVGLGKISSFFNSE